MRALGLLLTVVCMTGCEGPAGPPGEMGEQGEQGPPGMNGTAGLDVAASTLCQGTVLTPEGATFYSLKYSIVEYSNGDVWASCSISNGSTESADSNFYDSSQVGARTQGCSVSTDETGSFGWWKFELASAGYAATYNAVGSSNDGYVFEFDGPSSTQDGCTTFTP